MHNYHRLNIKQGIFLLFLSLIIFSFNAYSQQPPFIVKKIWDKAPHNAFTDLIRFEGKFYCTFREANSHAIRTNTTDFGRIRVLISIDGEDWQSFALIEKKGYDLRDPSWSITSTGKLMLLMAGSLYDGIKIACVHCQVSFFDQTKNSFSDPKPIKYDKKINSDLNWLWRVTWFKGKAYGVVYQFDKGISQAEIYLVESKDGVHYSLVTPLEVEGNPSETAINITPEGKLALLVRRDGKNEDGLYGESNYPFKKWNWVHTGYRIGGPRFIFGPGGEMLIGTRTFSKKGDWLTGLLVSDSTGRFRQIFEFPSKGDCSYPGMLIYNEILYFSYYSSHQGKPSIYMATIPVSQLQTMIQPKNDRNTEIGKRWTIDRARNWYNQHEWISGSDFIPSTAVNQLEMWQASTFDPETIDKELGWAENIGFNTMRVYLHSLAWEQDSYGFKQRVGQYLSIADKHKIKTIFVFFDDCWNKVGVPGVQPSPKTGIHNSGWVQDPGDPNSKDSTKFPLIERYVKDVMNYFSTDTRILLWDLYNEPGNSGKLTSTLPLLKNIFSWAREVNPDQPISAGLWNWSFNEFNEFQALNSDIITYHDYQEPHIHQNIINLLKTHGRPLICTEYMARTLNSRFSNILPMLKRENVGAINWGLVSGKTNTIYAWDKPYPDGGQPVEWFHDIFKNDGTPYLQSEVDLIKQINATRIPIPNE